MSQWDKFHNILIGYIGIMGKWNKLELFNKVWINYYEKGKLGCKYKTGNY